MSEKTHGPIYGIELIDSLPMGETMRQAMPSEGDLITVADVCERAAAGYEVLLQHWHDQKASIDDLVAACEGVLDSHESHLKSLLSPHFVPGDEIGPNLCEEDVEALRAAVANTKVGGE